MGLAQQSFGLGDGRLVFQNGVEHGDSGLFFLIQRNVLHGKDIFADQLMDDRIVDQQQICRFTGLMPVKIHTPISTADLFLDATRHRSNDTIATPVTKAAVLKIAIVLPKTEPKSRRD